VARPHTGGIDLGGDSVTATISVPRRFHGPPDSAHGGYACGLIAELACELLPADPRWGADGEVVVQLHSPPPLDVDLRMAVAGRRAHVWDGCTLIASAAYGPPPALAAGPVPLAVGEAAGPRYPGHVDHPYPDCYVCGPEHRDGGLRLAPGPVEDRSDLVACTWTPAAAHLGPEGSVRRELVWAVLDCPGGWSLSPHRSPLVLGRMSARIRALPRPGEPTVVVGHGRPGHGRTVPCGTAIYDADGAELARATAVWVRPTGRLAPTPTTPRDHSEDLPC